MSKYSTILHLMTIIVLSGITISCSTEFVNEPNFPETSLCEYHIHKLGLNEAISIADKFFQKTRDVGEIDSIEFVTRTNNTRSNEITDTLAFIINYANESGFLIIANDNRISPILAFSKESNFSIDNEATKDCFIDKIGHYIDSIDQNLTSLFNESYSAITDATINEYVIKTNLGQDEPFNQIVIQNHPGCKVGCGPLAAVMIASYSKQKFIYKSKVYNFNHINHNIVNKTPTNLGNDSSSWTNNYTGAVLAISQLASDFGEDSKSHYSKTDGTSTVTDSIYKVMKSAGFNVTSLNYSYSELATLLKLQKGYLIFQQGERKLDNGEKTGHAWVMDGYGTIGVQSHLNHTQESINATTGYFFHCNWGWSGKCNGFFRGDVFSPTTDRSYNLTTNFAVIRES